MLLFNAFLLNLFPLIDAAALPTSQAQKPLRTTSDPSTSVHQIPTVHESAAMARRMMRFEGSGSLSTIFPSTDSMDEVPTSEGRPSDVARLPYGLPEYIADCEPNTGKPTILQIDIANTFKNARAGSNVTLSIGWHPPGKAEGEYSGAMMPRYALFGWLQEMDLSKKEEKHIKSCWMKKHPETIWTPGGDIHESRWVRFIPEELYWFGGFGDRARIQWINLDEWHSVTEKEIETIRLPGEKGGGPVWPEWYYEEL